MAQKGVAKALSTELELEKGLARIERAKVGVRYSPLFHPMRRKLLEYLCRYPCSSVSKLCAELRISQPTAKWHLRKLDPYVRHKADVFGQTVFYVAGLVGDADTETLALLNVRTVRTLVLAVQKKPGIRTRELPTASRWYLRLALSHGLITAVRAGRAYRYYPTNLLERQASSNRRRIGVFRRNLLRKLVGDGLEPKLERARRELLVLRIKCPENELLILRTDPFATVLGEYKQIFAAQKFV